jgi:hypothetical protein
MNNHVETRDKLAGFFRKRISWVTGFIAIIVGLLAYFTASKLLALLKNAGVTMPNNIRNNFVTLSNQLGIVLYLGSWASGCLRDLSLQHVAYARITEQRRLHRLANISAVALLVVGAALPLLLTYASKTWFWSAMLLFVCVDVLAWFKLMVQGFQPTYEQSQRVLAREREDGHAKRLILLDLTYFYVAGPWKWKRYASMASVTILALILTRYPNFTIQVSSFINIPTYLVESAPLWIYLIVAEGWMWQYRLRCEFTASQIDEMFRPDSILNKLSLPAEGQTKTGAA